MIIASLFFSFVIPLYPPWPHDSRQRWCRFSLRAGSGFFPASSYLPKVSDRFSFSSSSTFREIGAFLLSLANPQWDRIILREEGRTSSPGYDVSPQHLSTRKKGQLQKSITYEKEKESEGRTCSSVKIRKWLGSAFSFEANILGLFGQRISGRIGGFRFFLFLYFREASCMAPPSRSWDALLFLARVISLEISIEFLDYRWRKSLECMNLSCINHHDFAKM